ncbi:MAG: T9SS type A sorting domain-containing protein [Crocinitomicaceae bacterium]|nr:T9SS type A sorting domain-containing protein [Crocinitomicaceae bacterium]
MKRKLLIVCSVLFFGSSTFGQTTDLGGPVSWKGKVGGNKDVTTISMPGFDLTAMQNEDAINDAAKDGPWRFGYKYTTDLTLENSGTWTIMPNGSRLWRMGIECEGAQTINLLFEDFYMPEGASLYLHDYDNTNRVGAYTDRNNRLDGLLGSELVHGDNIIIEYYEPAIAAGLGHFTIANVIHGYRTAKQHQGQFIKALNSSGDCNIDVNCPLGSAWGDQIRSVAMIVVSGNGYCTGALINNSCNDGTPYFLTANHCLSGGQAGNFVFRWNWESPAGTESCATTAGSTDPGPPYDQTSNGSTILVSGTQADHGLIQIDNMTLTDAQNWNLFYAGWNNDDTETAVNLVTGIHHPSGDVKKICQADDGTGGGIIHAVNSGAQTWEIDLWEQGVTEPGSSGSPLFDQNGRIIGQLYGGSAACTGTTSAGYDYYGRLGVSWGLGIDAYLDPASCGGSNVTNDGWDPNQPTLADDAGISGVTSPTGAYCVDNFIPEVTLRNFGTNAITSVTINYDIDGGTNNTFPWTGTLAAGGTVNVVLPLMTTTGGAHTFNAYTTLPNTNADSDASNDASSSSYTATIGGEDILFEIVTDCWGSETTWEVQDAGSNVVLSGGPYTDVTGGETISVNACLAIGCYDFIIDDSYGDGMFGSQWGTCDVNGAYYITQTSNGTLLDSIQAVDSDFGNQEINNFCIAPPCAATFDYSTVEELCFGDDNGSTTVNFLTGNTSGASYDIGSGPQASGTFSGLAQGSYTITVIDGDLCASTVSVTIGGPTELTATATATNISCAGQNDGTVTVTANGGTINYQYDIGAGNQGSGSFTGLGANSYTVTITDANGCSTTAGATVNDAVAVSGSVTSVTDVTNVNNGAIDITVLAGGIPYTYVWSGPSGFTFSGEDPTGLIAGTYSVIITDNCGNTVTLDNIIVNDYTGIEDHELINFTIYPNPSNGVVNIQLANAPAGGFDVAILDVAGRVVYVQDQMTNDNFVVDLSAMANGTYMLRVATENRQSTQRIVLRK